LIVIFWHRQSKDRTTLSKGKKPSKAFCLLFKKLHLFVELSQGNTNHQCNESWSNDSFLE